MERIKGSKANRLWQTSSTFCLPMAKESSLPLCVDPPHGASTSDPAAGASHHLQWYIDRVVIFSHLCSVILITNTPSLGKGIYGPQLIFLFAPSDLIIHSATKLNSSPLEIPHSCRHLHTDGN